MIFLKDNEFSEHIRLILLASLIGFFAGLASIGFKAMINGFQELFWRSSNIISAGPTQPWYLTVLIPAAGA
jgi:CIC family chloride channel protein